MGLKSLRHGSLTFFLILAAIFAGFYALHRKITRAYLGEDASLSTARAQADIAPAESGPASPDAAPAAPVPDEAWKVRLEFTGYDIVSNAEGSPREPFALELVRVFAVLRNADEKPIPADRLARRMPVFHIPDFVLEKGPEFAATGGFWNPNTETALWPENAAQASVQGHFKTGGVKTWLAEMGRETFAGQIRVRPDPGCYDSDGGEAAAVKGWVIGPLSCDDPAACVTTTRQEDRCKGSVLLEYVCENPEEEGPRKVAIKEIPCPDGCSDGACGG